MILQIIFIYNKNNLLRIKFLYELKFLIIFKIIFWERREFKKKKKLSKSKIKLAFYNKYNLD